MRNRGRVRYWVEWDDEISFGPTFHVLRKAVRWAKRYAKEHGHKYGRDVHVLRVERVQ